MHIQKTNSLELALSQDTREGGKHNIRRYLKNNQKGVRGRNRFGCVARLSQQLPLIIKKRRKMTFHLMKPRVREYFSECPVGD